MRVSASVTPVVGDGRVGQPGTRAAMGERPSGQMRLAVVRPASVEDGQACRQYARARWTESRELARFYRGSAIGGYRLAGAPIADSERFV